MNVTRQFRAGLLLVAATLAGVATVAHADTIGFDTGTGSFGGITTYSEDGYNFGFTNPGTLGIRSNNCSNAGSGSCAQDGSFWLAGFTSQGGSAFGDTITMVAANGGAFTFSGFDGAETLNNRPDFWAGQIQVVGIHADSSTVTQTFTLDGLDDGTGPGVDFQTFTSSSSDQFVELEFTGLTGAQGGHDFEIDNVVVNSAQSGGSGSVPEPGSLLLMGSGLTLVARKLRNRAA
jgi:hypothetical protein